MEGGYASQTYAHANFLLHMNTFQKGKRVLLHTLRRLGMHHCVQRTTGALEKSALLLCLQSKTKTTQRCWVHRRHHQERRPHRSPLCHQAKSVLHAVWQNAHLGSYVALLHMCALLVPPSVAAIKIQGSGLGHILGVTSVATLLNAKGIRLSPMSTRRTLFEQMLHVVVRLTS